MDIFCDRDSLINAVVNCQKAVGMKTASVIYEGINILARGSALVMNCTDREIGIESSIEADVREEGVLIVKARLFGEMVRKLPESRVRLYSRDDTKLCIISGAAFFEIFTISNEVFPPFPDVEQEKFFAIDQFVLKKMLQQTSFAICLDEGRKAITGLLMESSGNKLTCVAVDGYRMALRRHEIAGAGEEENSDGRAGVAGSGGGNVGVAGSGGGNTGAEENSGGNTGVEDNSDGGTRVDESDGGRAGSADVSGSIGVAGNGSGEGNVGAEVAESGGGSASTDESGSAEVAESASAEGNGNIGVAGVSEGIRQSGVDIKVIIPGRTVNELIKIIPSATGGLYIYGTKKQAVIEFGNCKVSTGLIEGEFFNYKYIVPEQTVTDIIIDTAAFLEAVERASLIIVSEYVKRYPVLLEIAGDKMKISSTSNLGFVDENISVDTTGKDMKVAFNPRYLVEALRTIEDETIKLSFTSEVGQCLLRPVNNEGFVHLVLPVKRV